MAQHYRVRMTAHQESSAVGIPLNRLAIALCQGLLTATVAGGFLQHPMLSGPAHGQSSSTARQNQTTAIPTIGVVQNRDNIAHWPTIMARLNQGNIPYQVIDWSSVRQQTDLGAFPILLLPNVKNVSARQTMALQAFVENGGHLVVSGPFGADATSAVQQQLRSLVGAYWAFALPQPTVLYPTAHRPIADEFDHQSPMGGGVIVPTGLRSDTLATWQESVEVSLPSRPGHTEVVTQGAPAIVATDQTTFLGWNWGHGDADTAFDSTWMTLTLTQHAATLPETAQQAVPAATRLLSQHLPQLTTADSDGDHAVAQMQSPPAPVPVPQIQRPPIPVPQAEPRVSPPIPIDPTEQVAPAGIDIGTGAGRIAPLEAIAMREELENLMGRFESALFSANAATYAPYFSLNNPDDFLSQRDGDDDSGASEMSASDNGATDNSTSDNNDPDESVLVASTASPSLPDQRPTKGVDVARQSTDPAQAILQQAQTLVDGFFDAVEQRDYATARQQWVQARQLLWDNFPSDRPIDQTEIRAMWFDRGTIVDAGSRQGLADIFDRLAASGINTIFFETVNAGYPIYPSEVAPTQNPLIARGWDPLADAVELAHERGMELHAWVWTFAAGNQRHNTLVNQPQSYLGPVLSAHPDWANVDDRGRSIPAGQTKPFLDPANPHVRDYLQSLYTEIVTHYDVDGLQLDYIRYPFQDPSAGNYYGYGHAARQQFRQQTEVDPLNISPADTELWQAWTDFRIQQVDSFVAETATHLKQLRPELILSAAVFPMSHHERMQKLQQNWEAWAQQGYIDLIVTMSYAMDTNRLQQLTAPWVTADPTVRTTDIGSALLLPGIRLLDLPDSAAIDQIQALRDMPAGGYALFAVENLNNNANLQTIFNQTQGDRTLFPSSIPYRRPFDAAVERFEALNREWNFALSTEQLWMRDPVLADWHAQSQSLQQSLQSLADDPSSRHLNRAKQDLQAFQTQFDDWMALHSLENKYRVQTWTNHLAIVQQLLEYGEQQRSR